MCKRSLQGRERANAAVMQTVSIVGLAFMAGFATPYVWTWADWKLTRRRKFYE